MPAPKLRTNQITSTETVKDGKQTYLRHRGVLTAEQKKYFDQARAAVEAKFPPKKPAKKSAKRPRIEVLLGADEQEVFAKVDEYLIAHSLPNRGAVARVALGQLLGIDLKIPQRGWVPGRSRKKAAKKTTSRRVTPAS